MIHGDYIAFWGSVFSNFFPCEFHLEGAKWCCSEQYYMYKKAVTFNDFEVALQIRQEVAPKVIKQLGRQVRGFDENVWNAVSLEFMKKAVLAKFEQNDYLRSYMFLPEFEGKHFVEGSPVDNIWGCGISWKDPAIADKANWTGKNLLGQTLDWVKEQLGK